jgi:hypothetical protein
MPHRDLHRRILALVSPLAKAYEQREIPIGADPAAYKVCQEVRKLIQTYEHTHHDASHKKPKPRDLADTE